MGSSKLPLRGVVSVLAALGLAASGAYAADAPVTITDNGANWTMDNGIVKATINKRNSNMTALVYKGINTMGGGGYWEQTPSGTVTQTVTIDPATNGGERGEVSVKGVGGRGLDMEFRYTLGKGDSGIYVYGIYSHKAGAQGAGAGESRYITKLSKDFNWISVDADRNMLECTPEDWAKGVVIHAKEQRILSTGYYKNSVEHKYSYNAVQYKIPAWGWSSTKDHIGVYFINPTTEYLGGGASKMELVAHFDANESPDPIILNYWSAGHYGGGATANAPAGQDWTKVIGPMFVYCTSIANPKEASAEDLKTLEATAGNPTVPPAWKDNATAMWQDALAQAKKEKAKWPYDWVQGVDYPHKEGRGTVSGQLALADPQASSTKLPHLTVGLAHADYPGNNQRSGNSGFISWDHDATYYQFWTDGSDDGKFTLTHVRPGSYTLHAFADGVLGEYAKTDITVEAGKAIDLGTLKWTPLRLGKQVWEIGSPNRTGDKFFKGDRDNYWLWGWPLRYSLLFPDDITFTIGKSDPAKDWFFVQCPHSETTAWLNPEAKDPRNQRFGWVKAESVEQYPHSDSLGPWKVYGDGRATTWTIKFNMPAAAHGQAVLRLALAGSDSTAGLSNPGARGSLAVGVNKQHVGDVEFISTNAIRYNTNTGVWRQYVQAFDASLLKAGENSIELTVPAGEVTSGVVYDYLRLELNEDAKPDAPVPDPMKP